MAGGDRDLLLDYTAVLYRAGVITAAQYRRLKEELDRIPGDNLAGWIHEDEWAALPEDESEAANG